MHGCQYFITIWTRPYTGVSSHSDTYEASPGTVRDTNSGIGNGLISQSPKGIDICKKMQDFLFYDYACATVTVQSHNEHEPILHPTNAVLTSATILMLISNHDSTMCRYVVRSVAEEYGWTECVIVLIPTIIRHTGGLSLHSPSSPQVLV